MANEEDHALVADGETPTEFALMDNIENKRSKKVKEGVGYNAVPPPAVDLYISSKKDLSWTGLPEFVDDTVIDYSRPSPTVASTSAEDQNNDASTSKEVASTNPPKPFVKFVKPKDSQPESKSKERKHLRNHKSSFLNKTGEVSKWRQIGLKIIHIRVLHIDLLVTDQMVLI
nr:hypothetical protein [Tanacetum cinerariifolium]